jgi:hypothetical protein
LPLDRYRDVRKTVNKVFETLDFQGKIDGPLDIDVEHASADMKARLSGDPFSELAPASAAALRAKMSKLIPVWVEYEAYGGEWITRFISTQPRAAAPS